MTGSQVRSARAFNSGSLEVLIHAHMQALSIEDWLRQLTCQFLLGCGTHKTPSPIRPQIPNFFVRLIRKSHMIVIGRSASARSMNASQPARCIQVNNQQSDYLRLGGYNILPTSRLKSACLWVGQHVAFPITTSSGFHKAATGRHCTKVRMMAIVHSMKLPIIAP